MKQKIVILSLILSAVAIPLAANAQYGGGGGGVVIGGIFGFGYHNDAPKTPAPAPAPTTGGFVLGASTYNFTINLQLHDKGTAVTELQKLLVADGFLDSDKVSGYFGFSTYKAVLKYQAFYKIQETGFVGPLTRAQLNQN